jgi:hypothetical protein
MEPRDCRYVTQLGKAESTGFFNVYRQYWTKTRLAKQATLSAVVSDGTSKLGFRKQYHETNSISSGFSALPLGRASLGE